MLPPLPEALLLSLKSGCFWFREVEFAKERKKDRSGALRCGKILPSGFTAS
jgi:hypothetical protein